MHNVGGINVQGGSYPAAIWGSYMQAALEGQPSIPFPKPDFSLIPGARPIGSVSPTTVTTGPAASSTTTPTSTPPPTIPDVTRPDITRPPRPTVTTQPRPATTRKPRCYVDPRTNETICR